jgi:hypothetical protein
VCMCVCVCVCMCVYVCVYVCGGVNVAVYMFNVSLRFSVNVSYVDLS